MIARITLALLFASIGAVVAAVFTALTAAAAFVTGAYIGSKMENDETENTSTE
jgi:hypothetical protein